MERIQQVGMSNETRTDFDNGGHIHKENIFTSEIKQNHLQLKS